MGGGRWTSIDWDSFQTTTTTGKTTSQVFTTNDLKAEFDPTQISIRESRDSRDNPKSLPIILASDVTSSMGLVADQIIRTTLNDVATAIQAEPDFGDPHVMVMAVGDANFDKAPLQVTQFEADIRIADQTSQLWLEKGGGYNTGESYGLAHLFASKKIKADAWEKRKQKGFLFSIGDEPPLPVTKSQAQTFLGIDIKEDLTAERCAKMVSEMFEVFHIVLINEGFARKSPDMVVKAWEKVLPNRVILLQDVAQLGETIISAIKSCAKSSGRSVSVQTNWSKTPTLAVARLA